MPKKAFGYGQRGIWLPRSDWQHRTVTDLRKELCGQYEGSYH